MVDGPAIVDPIQAGCAAGRDAWSVDVAAGLEPPARAVLLMRAALACTILIEQLPGPPLHDAAVARERFVWAFVLGYTEGTRASGPEIKRRDTPSVMRRARRAAPPRAAVRALSSVRIPPTRRRRTLRQIPW